MSDPGELIEKSEYAVSVVDNDNYVIIRGPMVLDVAPNGRISI